MAQHEKKACPRCQKQFECKPGNITQCQCYGVGLTAVQRNFIEQRYADCLCRECLKHLSCELNIFTEKYIPRE